VAFRSDAVPLRPYAQVRLSGTVAVLLALPPRFDADTCAPACRRCPAQDLKYCGRLPTFTSRSLDSVRVGLCGALRVKSWF
jgi:hypothetical protein